MLESSEILRVKPTRVEYAMLFYNLGLTSWEEVQAIACALAQLGREGAVLARSASPGVCAGGHVDLDRQVDFELCRARKIPIFHRRTRGKTICFAQSQMELQLILSPKHRLLTVHTTERANCRMILTPYLNACRDLGLEVSYKAPDELVVGGKRIASACLGDVHQQVVIAASLSLDFDADTFAGVLNVNEPQLRARIAELAGVCRTSLRQELGQVPSWQALEKRVRAQLQLIAGGLRPVEIDPALRAQMRDNAATLFAPTHGQSHEAQPGGWKVDIGAGTELRQCAFKAPGGLVRAVSEWQDGRIIHASLGGDFFSYPPGALYRLEQALVGTPSDQVTDRIMELYRKMGLITPGIHAAHWAKVLCNR